MQAFLGYLSRMQVPDAAKPKWALSGQAPPVKSEKRSAKVAEVKPVDKAVLKAAEKGRRIVAHKVIEASVPQSP